MLFFLYKYYNYLYIYMSIVSIAAMSRSISCDFHFFDICAYEFYVRFMVAIESDFPHFFSMCKYNYNVFIHFMYYYKILCLQFLFCLMLQYLHYIVAMETDTLTKISFGSKLCVGFIQMYNKNLPSLEKMLFYLHLHCNTC